MTKRENITRAAACNHPEYIPCDIPCDIDWLTEDNPEKIQQIIEMKKPFEHYVGGILKTESPENMPPKHLNPQHWYDSWMTEWEDDGHGAKACGYPLVDGYDKLESYKFPNSEIGKIKLRIQEGYTREEIYLRGGVWFTLFERLWMLRDFTNMLTDPYLYPNDFKYLRDKVVDFNISRINQQLAVGADGMFFSDDWGSQRGLMMNPDDWRKYYKPSYEKMFRPIRDAGKQVWFHSCGDVKDIIGDLIDVGVNVLNPVQPQAMDVDYLAKEFEGKVCFYGGVDVQGTMIHSSPQDVKDEAMHLVDIFGSKSGGYMLSTSHSIMPETPLDNVIALYEVALEVINQK
ncbi:MAG: hypothetical protein KAQ68_06285 [Clostridiales bacterium]|nr:hypothetical protein [Clostridiales bacterium]